MVCFRNVTEKPAICSLETFLGGAYYYFFLGGGIDFMLYFHAAKLFGLIFTIHLINQSHHYCINLIQIHSTAPGSSAA